MKYSLAILAFAAAASAQVTGCGGKAQECIDKAIADSGICKAGDSVCGCENLSTIQAGATECVIASCDSITDALAVAEEAKAVCEELLAGGGGDTPTTSAKPTEAEPTAEPTGEEPSEPTGAEPTTDEPSYEEPTTTASTPEPSGDGSTPEEPTPSGDGGDDDTPVEAGASAFAPVGALAAALFAFAL